MLGLAAVAILIGLGVWVISNQSDPENVELPESLELPPLADGSSWGPAGAPVLIEEYSDFQ
jgi:hypothetical protein